jgi:hypothetical protein
MLSDALPIWGDDDSDGSTTDSDYPGLESCDIVTEQFSSLGGDVEDVDAPTLIPRHDSHRIPVEGQPPMPIFNPIRAAVFLLAVSLTQLFNPDCASGSHIRVYPEDTTCHAACGPGWEDSSADEDTVESGDDADESLPDCFPNLVISDAELEISRRVLNGELDINDGMALLVRLMGASSL